MDPDTTCWIRNSFRIRDEHGKEIPWQLPMGLKAMVQLAAPDHKQLCDIHHPAGAGATMCWQICQALARHTLRAENK